MSNNEKLVLVEGRVAFNKNLFNPNKKGRYTLAVVYDKNDEKTIQGYEVDLPNGEKSKRAGMAELKEYVNGIVSEKWGKKPPGGLKTPVKLETREDMLENYPFMRNAFTLNASNGFNVEVGKLENNAWVDINENEIKAGDYVEVIVSGYSYDNETKGVGLNIHSVLKTRDGEAFYSRQSGADMFGVAKAEPAKDENASYDNFGF